jgi:hypothetical protein
VDRLRRRIHHLSPNLAALRRRPRQHRAQLGQPGGVAEPPEPGVGDGRQRPRQIVERQIVGPPYQEVDDVAHRLQPTLRAARLDQSGQHRRRPELAVAGDGHPRNRLQHESHVGPPQPHHGAEVAAQLDRSGVVAAGTELRVVDGPLATPEVGPGRRLQPQRLDPVELGAHLVVLRQRRRDERRCVLGRGLLVGRSGRARDQVARDRHIKVHVAQALAQERVRRARSREPDLAVDGAQHPADGVDEQPRLEVLQDGVERAVERVQHRVGGDQQREIARVELVVGAHHANAPPVIHAGDTHTNKPRPLVGRQLEAAGDQIEVTRLAHVERHPVAAARSADAEPPLDVGVLEVPELFQVMLEARRQPRRRRRRRQRAGRGRAAGGRRKPAIPGPDQRDQRQQQRHPRLRSPAWRCHGPSFSRTAFKGTPLRHLMRIPSVGRHEPPGREAPGSNQEAEPKTRSQTRPWPGLTPVGRCGCVEGRSADVFVDLEGVAK